MADTRVQGYALLRRRTWRGASTWDRVYLCADVCSVTLTMSASPEELAKGNVLWRTNFAAVETVDLLSQLTSGDGNAEADEQSTFQSAIGGGLGVIGAYDPVAGDADDSPAMAAYHLEANTPFANRCFGVTTLEPWEHRRSGILQKVLPFKGTTSMVFQAESPQDAIAWVHAIGALVTLHTKIYKLHLNQEPHAIIKSLPSHHHSAPEQRLAALHNRKFGDVAVCTSGGGNRAMILTVGYLRALRKLGLLQSDKIGYISAVSGGAWATSVYTFLKPGVGAKDDDDLLGAPCENVSTLTLNNLDQIPEGKLARCATISFLPIAKQLLLDGTKFRRMWDRIVARVFLAPFGLDDDNPFVMRELEKEIKQRNPSLQGIELHMPTDSSRPFWITNGAAFVPHAENGIVMEDDGVEEEDGYASDSDESGSNMVSARKPGNVRTRTAATAALGPDQPVQKKGVIGSLMARVLAASEQTPQEMVLLQFNAMYSGCPVKHEFESTLVKTGPLRIGGGMVETFAYGTREPSAHDHRAFHQLREKKVHRRSASFQRASSVTAQLTRVFSRSDSNNNSSKTGKRAVSKRISGRMTSKNSSGSSTSINEDGPVHDELVEAVQAVQDSRGLLGTGHSLRLPIPQTFFSLRRAVGVTSHVMSKHYYGNKMLKQLIDDPPLWSPQVEPTGAENDNFPQTAHAAHKLFLGDGGYIDYAGLFPALQRGMKKVIVFLNGSWPLVHPDSDYEQWGFSELTTLFGVNSKAGMAMPTYMRFNQVFKNEMLRDLITQFHDQNAKGEPMIARQKLEVLSNKWVGCSGGWDVDIIWVHLSQPEAFMDELPVETAEQVRLEDDGKFPGAPYFPFFKSAGQVNANDPCFNNEQTNLLDRYAEWCIMRKKDMFLDLVNGGEGDGSIVKEELI